MSPSPMPSIAWITLDHVIIAEASIPLAFTEDDILHYVLIEQAQLFPTLDQEIYFDFLIKSEDEENKKISIVACNKKDFLELAPTILFLKIAHDDFETINLLPWRQQEKNRIKKKELKILAIVAVSASMFMLAISVFYIHMAHHNKKRAMVLAHRKQIVISKLTALEESNQVLQALVDRRQNKINVARHQSDLEEKLKTAEVQRPQDLVLEKILWQNNILIIKGKTKEAAAVKAYISHLAQNKIDAQLKFMGVSLELSFPVKFEIEAKDLLA